jgi:hypothetical protein
MYSNLTMTVANVSRILYPIVMILGMDDVRYSHVTRFEILLGVYSEKQFSCKGPAQSFEYVNFSSLVTKVSAQ